jgi:hypothetical protein
MSEHSEYTSNYLDELYQNKHNKKHKENKEINIHIINEKSINESEEIAKKEYEKNKECKECKENKTYNSFEKTTQPFKTF